MDFDEYSDYSMPDKKTSVMITNMLADNDSAIFMDHKQDSYFLRMEGKDFRFIFPLGDKHDAHRKLDFLKSALSNSDLES